MTGNSYAKINKMVERYKKTYLNSRLTYQYIEQLTDPKNTYLFEPFVGFFNVMFWIYSDHLILSLIKLFDPAGTGKNENFSIKGIEDELGMILMNREEPSIKDAIKVLKEYRNKHLAHLDDRKDRIDFPSTHELLEYAKILLDACYEGYKKMRGEETDIAKNIILFAKDTILNPLESELFMEEAKKKMGSIGKDEKEKQFYQELDRKYQEWKHNKNLN